MPSGQVIVLNGTPRSGKSSVAAEIQASFDGVWLNLGVDSSMAVTPTRFRPGIGLRPGGERPDLEPVVASLYRALYGSVVAYSNEGIDVVVDVGHHESYANPLDTLGNAARLLAGRQAWLIGIRCPVDVVISRREATGMVALREMVERWEREVHRPGIYDAEVNTSLMTPKECAEVIRSRMAAEPTAFKSLARGRWCRSSG